jgi:preprotein translocase subunit SecD
LAIAQLLLLVCASCQRNPPRALSKSATLEVYTVLPAAAPNSRTAFNPENKSQIYLAVPPILASADVATVQRILDQNQPALKVVLNASGAKKLSAATSSSTGQELAIVVNGHVTAVPKVRSALSNNFSISGGSFQKDQEDIFAALTEE